MIFNTIDIEYEVLESAIESFELTGGETRKIDYEIQTGGNAVVNFFVSAGRFIGFLFDGWQKIKTFFSVGWTRVVAFLEQATNVISNFDWNASDKEIQGILKNNAQTAASLIGDFLGFAAVRLVGLGIAGGVSILFPVIGGIAFASIVDDSIQEAPARIKSLLVGLTSLALDSAIYSLVLAGRWIARRFGFGIPTGAERLGPGNASFASKTEEKIEKIDNRFLRSLVESGLDSAFDEIFQVGYVVAAGVDEYYAMQRAGGKAVVLGPERQVRFTPDERVPSEQLVIAGPQDLVIQNVEQITSEHALLWNRDIGAFVGEATEDYVKRSPQALRIQIQFRSAKTPPWRDAEGFRARSVTYTIPNVKRSALDWQTIKTAAGGNSGYTWGPYRATARVSSGSQMAVYGSSEAEAEARLRQLLTLSEDRIVTLSISEEKTEGMRAANPSLIKRPTQVYPAYFTIYNRQDLLISANAATDRIQTRSAARARIPLWMNEEPRDASRTIQELLRRGTTRSQ